MEVFYQASGQIILLLVATTSTPTTGGLETLFEQSPFLGIPPVALLGLSVLWSMKTCITLNLKSIRTDKVFCPATSTVFLLFCSLFGTIRRIMAMVCFFIPTLGLSSILHHWQAEQIPFRMRLDHARKFNITAEDKIGLHGLSETVLWNQLDRWDYSNPQKPTPPPYHFYTGITLKESFGIFFSLLVIHFLIVLIVKLWTSVDFRKRGNYFVKAIHVIENLNTPSPFKDWDEGQHTVKEFRKKHQETNREMGWLFAVTVVINMLMVVPLMITGKVLSRNSIR